MALFLRNEPEEALDGLLQVKPKQEMGQMDDPKFEEGQQVRVKAEAESPGPPAVIWGKMGTVEGYTGIFGGGSIETLPIQDRRHQYLVAVDADGISFHLINEDWLEQAAD